MIAAEILVDLARWWLIIGGGVAAVFLTIGIDRIDEDARGAYAFRPLLIPAVLLIWPLVLGRWIRLERRNDSWAARYRPPRAAHTIAAVVMAVALAVAVISGLGVRQSWPADVAPQHLSEGGSS